MDILEQFFIEKGSSENTKKQYITTSKKYTQLNSMTLEELIQEADVEEEERIRWKNRKLRTRLIEYRNYLYSNYAEGSAKLYFSALKTIYRHYCIEIGDLPTFKSKQIDKTYELEYKDILTKDQLIDAYHEANNTVKNIILFASSSGMSKVDLLKLTVGDFIEACSEYITTRELIDQLQELKGQTIIPRFKGERKKTNIKFVTFCSPEAAEHIIQELIGRDVFIRNAFDDKKLQLSDPLFDISNNHLLKVFRDINDKLGLGRVGKFSKFRCHMLRKYQATTLLNCNEVHWTIEEIDSLQGRTLDKTHRAYFKDSDEKLFEKYYDSIDDLMLFKSIHEVDKETVEKLEKENDFYKTEIEKNETKLEEQQEKIDKILKMQEELEALVGL